MRRRGRHPDGAAEKFEQNLDPTSAVQALQDAESPRKRTRHEPDPVPDCKIVGPIDQSASLVARLNQGLDDPGSDRQRAFAVRDQALNAERAVDASPALPADVEDDEDIAWEYRREHGGEFACVASRLEVNRHEAAIALIGEICLGDTLFARQSRRDIPSFAGSEMETLGVQSMLGDVLVGRGASDGHCASRQ